MADEKEEKPGEPEQIVEESSDDEDDYYETITADEIDDCRPGRLYTIVIEEEMDVDLGENDDIIEDYWEKGWESGFTEFNRSNFDVYNDRYVQTFPTRFKLSEFTLTKSLRRVLNKNKDLKTIVRPLRITDAKEKLNSEYYKLRHDSPNRSSLSKIYDYIKYYPSDLTELCVFKDDRLIACTIFEVGNDSVFGSLCFWDMNESRRSLGILTVLLEIKYALGKNMKYYYLGQYYKQNPNYQYKTRFSGLQLFNWESFTWVDFKDPLAKEMLDQKLPRHKS